MGQSSSFTTLTPGHAMSLGDSGSGSITPPSAGEPASVYKHLQALFSQVARPPSQGPPVWVHARVVVRLPCASMHVVISIVPW